MRVRLGKPQECSGRYAGPGFEGAHAFAPNPMTGRIECVHCGEPTTPQASGYAYVCGHDGCRRERLGT